MDTKLRRTKKAGIIITVPGAVISIVIFLMSVSVSLCINDIYMYMISGAEDRVPHNENLMENYLSAALTVAVIAGLAGFILLIISAMCVGQRDEKGIRMNWFDHVYTELKLAGSGLLFYVLYILMMLLRDFTRNGRLGTRLFYASGVDRDQFLTYTYGSTVREGLVSETFLLTICFVAFILTAAFYVAVFLSLVKHFKNGSFLRSFVIIEGICRLADAVKRSEKTDIIVMASLLGGIVLSATFFGSFAVLIVTLVVVPGLLRQYNAIRSGVKKVKEGDPGWKIPVNSKSDLGRLALDINDISSATELAIENELKHQKMKTDLISNVSHDLKTPLTAMISYVDLLKKEGLDSENAEEYLRIIEEKTMRLKSLTENLFEAAKASSGEIPVHLMTIEMSALISQAEAELEERFKARRLELISSTECENTSVTADGQLLWRVLENLLVNVSKYALEGSRVYMDLSRKGNMIRLEIKNISADRLNISPDELMERFTRGDESRNTEGSGLGLAIARDLTALMNGRFEISIDGDLFKAVVELPEGE